MTVECGMLELKEVNNMGFDVHGLSPKMNVELDDTSIYGMIESIQDYEKRWEMQDNLNKKDRNKYWKEYEDYHDNNPGIYFRNNVWWWRPLWTFVCEHCDDILTEEEMNAGSYNDGRKINSSKAVEISVRLSELIDNGTVDEYSKDYEEQRKKMEKSEQKDTKFMASYPFSTENVIRFALFCGESGGFTIC